MRLPALSGLLLALCFPPLHTLVLPFVALTPLAVWTARLPGGSPGRRASVRGGALLGAVGFGLLLHWIPVALVGASPTATGTLRAVAAFVLIVAGLAALTALFVRLLHHAVHDVGAPLWLALAVTWTALEWSRAHLPGSLALPWLGLGTSLTAFPEVVGMAEVVGERGVTFWLAAVAGLIAELWIGRGRGRRSSPPWRAVATVLLIALPPAWGFWRAGTLETRVVAEVAVVQPAAQGRVKVGDASRDTVHLPPGALPAVVGPVPGALEPVVAPPPPDGPSGGPPHALAPGRVDLVVLPELVLRGDPRSPAAVDAVAHLRRFSAAVDAPVLFGALGVDDTPSGAVEHNSVFLMEPTGLDDFRYDKHRLVPGVEAGSYGVGRSWPLAEVGGARFGVLICYESSFSDVALALRRQGADALVNVTNDAWLGGGPVVGRTVALWQHPAHLVMRAIEGRVGVVRAANTGVSLYVDPSGRTHHETGLFTTTLRVAQVRSAQGPTLYVRFGDVLGSASALAALALLLLVVGARRADVGSPSLDPSKPHV